MKAELKTITPAIAMDLLEKNYGNRSLNKDHVERLAKEIKEGRWKINGDMIRIGNSGRILDGQHRLNAVIKSGRTIQTWMMEGLDDDIFDTIDVGKKRSGGDTLASLGEEHPFRLAAALALVDKYMTGRVLSYTLYSNGEIKELAEKYPLVRDAIVSKTNGKGILPPAVIDACNYLFSQKDPKAASEFIDRVLKGHGLEEWDPAYILRERLVMNTVSKSKLKRGYIFALCIKAWNAYRSGRKMRCLRVRENEDFPIVQ